LKHGKIVGYNNHKLWNQNPVPPTINIQIEDLNTDEIIYSRWYDFANFKRAEPSVYNFLKNKFLTMNPLT
jgi:hypothetical protein